MLSLKLVKVEIPQANRPSPFRPLCHGVGRFHFGLLGFLSCVSCIMRQKRNSLQSSLAKSLSMVAVLWNTILENIQWTYSVCFHIVRIYSVRILFHLYLEKVACFGNLSFAMRIHTSQIPLSEMLWAKRHAVQVRILRL